MLAVINASVTGYLKWLRWTVTAGPERLHPYRPWDIFPCPQESLKNKYITLILFTWIQEPCPSIVYRNLFALYFHT